MQNKWPSRKTGILLTSENDYYARGWNDCLEQCDKARNEEKAYAFPQYELSVFLRNYSFLSHLQADLMAEKISGPLRHEKGWVMNDVQLTDVFMIIIGLFWLGMWIYAALIDFSII